MDFLLRTRLRIAQIDLFAGEELDSSERSELIAAALQSLQEEGAQLVLMARMAGCPSGSLLRNRFVPLPADLNVTCVVPQDDIPRQKFKSFHLHVR